VEKKVGQDRERGRKRENRPRGNRKHASRSADISRGYEFSGGFRGSKKTRAGKGRERLNYIQRDTEETSSAGENNENHSERGKNQKKISYTFISRETRGQISRLEVSYGKTRKGPGEGGTQERGRRARKKEVPSEGS